jgi:S1-C subfamily serine protease
MIRILFALFLLIPALLFADEGQWPPDELKSLPFSQLHKRGLKLNGSDLWTQEGKGLLSAATDLAGCSSGFVSRKGLILTNYHCAFDAVQQASTLQKNYVKDGFLAHSLSEES